MQVGEPLDRIGEGLARRSGDRAPGCGRGWRSRWWWRSLAGPSVYSVQYSIMGYLAVALRAAASDRVGFKTAGSVAGSLVTGQHI